MDENKKEGFSVKEIEQFAKRHWFEVFFCLVFLLTCVFGIMGTFRSGWSLFLGMVGAILGILFSTKIAPIMEKATHFVFRQDKTIQIVFAVVALILAIFLPFTIFLIVGTMGGLAIHKMVSNVPPKT
jgi:hypothetical protein